MKIIDPHLHLFNLEQGNYHWLKSGFLPAWFQKDKINRSFNDKKLELEDENEISGFVHIEAGFDNDQPWKEIEWLESTVKLPFKSIAGLDLTLSEEVFEDGLRKLAKFSSFVGIRHILEEHTLETLQKPNVKKNLESLASKNLIFEIQMPISELDSLDELIPIISKTSNTWVVNHCGLAPVELASEQGYDWLLALHRLSQYDNVVIKCSGWEMLNQEQDYLWTVEVVQHCLQNFGEDRVMLASNFPLCLFEQSYTEQWNLSLGLTSTQTVKLSHDNANRIYRLGL